MLPPESLAIIAGAGVVGEALAVRMAQDGAAVAVLDLNPDRASAVRDRAAALGTRAIAVQTDLGSTQSVEAAVETVVSQLGEPSVLVNVVGGMAMFAGHRPLYEWTDHDWELIRALNYDYVFRSSREALKRMVPRRTGTIVNIASISGINAAPNQAPYGAAKAAVMSLTRSMALECGRFGIRVNAIAPGPVETPAASTATLGESANRVTSMIPLGRRASLDDIGDATLFLASPMASYITGQTLVVDGGLTLRFPIPLPGSDATEAP